MEIKVESILGFLGNSVTEVKGTVQNRTIKYLKDASEVDEFAIDWINPAKSEKQSIAENSKAKILLVDKSVLYSDAIREANKVLIYVENPKIAILNIGNHFFVKKPLPGIHASAVIDKKAVIGDGVFIGAGCVIGECIIMNGASIHPNVTIYDNVTVGENSVIYAGAVLGAEGLGCLRQSDGSLLEFPQLGGVTIGSNVRIGPNSIVFSGALSRTIISDGCKINGACFIGSNVVLGRNVWITGSSMLAGSVKVEDNVTIYSKVIVREQKTIGKNSIIGMGSVVTKDVPSNETWVGNPARKLK